MLNQSKELLCICICVAFQGSKSSIKEETETNIYDMFYNIGGDFKAALALM